MSNKSQVLFFVITLALVANFGVWSGQSVSDVRNSTATNAAFLVGVTIFDLLLYLFLKKRLRLTIPHKWLLAVFFVNLTITAFFRPELVLSLRQLAAIFLSFGVVLFLSSLLHSVKIDRALFIVSFTMFIVLNLTTIVHIVTTGPLIPFEHGPGRLSGLFFFGEVGMMAGFSALLSMIGLITSHDRKHVGFYLFTIPLMLFYLACTDTRSAMLGFVVSFAVLILLHRSRQRLIAQLLVLAVFFAVVLIAYQYLTTSESGQAVSGDIDYRSLIWASAFIGVLTRPLIGYGNVNYFEEVNYSGQFGPVLDDAHSAMLGHALAFGIPSLLLFMLYYSWLAKDTLLRGSKRKRIYVVLALYWVIAPFFWGQVYKVGGNFIQILFGVCMIGLMSHPDIFRSGKEGEIVSSSV